MSPSRLPGGRGALFFFIPLLIVFILGTFYFASQYRRSSHNLRALIQQDEIRQQEIKNLRSQNDKLQSELSEIGTLIEQKEAQLKQKEATLEATKSIAEQRETTERILTQKKELILLEQQKKLAQKMKKGIESKQVTLKRDQTKLILTIPNSELFEPGSDALKNDSTALLSALSGFIIELPSSIETRVLSHHDTTPLQGTLAQKYNSVLDLTTARAQVIAKSLIKSTQLPPHRIIPLGLGETQPLSKEENSSAKTLNRRVEIIFDLNTSLEH